MILTKLQAETDFDKWFGEQQIFQKEAQADCRTEEEMRFTKAAMNYSLMTNNNNSKKTLKIIGLDLLSLPC